MAKIKRNRNKGGRGRSEDLRNKAMVYLHNLDSEEFNPSSLARIFHIDRSTASRNIYRDQEKYLKNQTVVIGYLSTP